MKDKSKVLKTYGYMFDKLSNSYAPRTQANLGATRPPIRQTNRSLSVLIYSSFSLKKDYEYPK